MSVAFRTLSGEMSQLEVKIVTGADAWRTSADTGGTAFELSGGADLPTASFEVTVDAAGLEITPRRQEVQLPTDDARKTWTFVLNGAWTSDLIMWVTLFSSGRYTQAIQLDSGELERHAQR